MLPFLVSFDLAVALLLVSTIGCQALLLPQRFVVSRTARTRVGGLSNLRMSSSEKKSEPPAISSADQYLGDEDRPYQIGSRPNSAALLAGTNFFKEIGAIFENLLITTEKKSSSLPELLHLRLTNEAVAEAERLREERGGRVEAHPVSRFLYDVGCSFLDHFFDGRPIARFWFLETVARIPYFSYVSMLHLYETLGWWRIPGLRKIHNAEEWNELHHLLIMEQLGGDRYWSDRFLGYHAAIVYYWALIATYLFSPAIAYQFMELLEAHAVDTYGTFLVENEEDLKKLPAPSVAVSYYTGADLYEFDEFQVSRPVGSRRPVCDTLYDTFKNIKEDEAEHVRTMQACQDYANLGTMVVSPHLNLQSNKESYPPKKGDDAPSRTTTTSSSSSSSLSSSSSPPPSSSPSAPAALLKEEKEDTNNDASAIADANDDVKV